ncbi:NAD(P)-dependent oxidoreductase [Herbiconiux sp. CPCC 203407]|uniref:NAD(P)-dependent oxidoreductase n=1 Tax=Herbiconiux oxytropis TaxID=2970915 RepID=A0AA42BTD5_9MICO|nr:NAD(P)-dependent oxidoreductase [Herbiconiux oxytropis]MCS5721271.1 NAD(P)-dependent oxidoreductase [Herbiconiux oxytropis]MCS5726290.1 NAD(P)-dependent oxidoreductase [Herbiconiux oxytropis]
MTDTTATRVLVTGASGFVGGALMGRLRREPGIEAIGIGRRRLDDADYRSLDLTSPDAASRLAALRWPSDGQVGTGPDVIVHAAARSSPWGTRAEFERENVEATRAVLDHAARLPRRPRVVLVSTASVLYRAHDQLEVPDDAPAGRPFVNHYAATKHAAEELVRAAGGDWVVLRPRAVFGPGDTTLFPRIVEAARRGRFPRLRAERGPTPVVNADRSGLGERPRRGWPVVCDLVPVETLVEYLLRACHEPAVLGRTLTVTGGETVELEPAVRGILSAAGVPYPAREVPRALALAAATVVETGWRLTRRRTEPPITRYSVIVYAYSKTFDGRACHRLLGPPPVTVHAALAAFTDGLAGRTGRADAAGGATS